MSTPIKIIAGKITVAAELDDKEAAPQPRPERKP